MSGFDILIPGWLVVAVVGSAAWFFAYRFTVRRLERRYWNTGATMLSERKRFWVSLGAGPVVWIALALDSLEGWWRR